jgi:hypothetical protein
MTAVGHDPLVSDEKAAAGGVKKVTLDELWRTADFITLHTPLNDATRGLINAATLAKCKKGVFIINAARGGVVAEGDLLAALNSGHVAGAALDVFEQEPPGAASRALIAHPKVVCTPHLGASTEEAQRKVAREIAQQMSDAFALKGFVGAVNARHLGLATTPALEPFVRTAEALGSLQGQFLLAAASARAAAGGGGGGGGGGKGPISVKVEVEGPELGGAPGVGDLLKVAVLKGMLPFVPAADLDPDAVNLVNAAHLADEVGLRVAVRASAHSSSSYANAVRVVVSAPGAAERVATGSCIEGEPRVVQVDHWASFPSFTPRGHVLLFNNMDAPGVVGRVTAVLADYHINIANMSVARQPAGGVAAALSVFICDQRIPSEAAAKIEALDGITNVRTASFGSAFAAAGSDAAAA